MKTLIIFSLFSLSILFLSFPETFADHGSGGGGGCSGDCTPPTMGKDSRQNQSISGGFGINDKSFDVGSYSQSIPTQFSNVGDSINISLTISENSGAFYLTTVQLMLGEKDELVGGVLIPVHDVKIVWEKTLDGNESFFVIDDNELISDVDVTSFVNGDPAREKITNLTFSFTPVASFDPNPISVTMWDYNRNSWTNYFNNALEIGAKDTNAFNSVTSKNAELQIPSWVKNNAGFWSQELINDSTFLTGIKYCIENKIIHIPNMPTYSSENTLHFVDSSKDPQHYVDRYHNEPSYKEWFDTNFPDYTIEEAVGLSSDSADEIPLWIKTNAGWWADDQIDDETFVQGLEYLINNGILRV